MTEFTPLASTAGGMMIGLSAVLLMLWEGRIAGISGIAGRLLPPYLDKAFPSRLAFVIGLVAAPLALTAATGTDGTSIATGRVCTRRHRTNRP